MNIVILIPSRGRPEQCVQAVGQIYATASERRLIEVLVGADADDPAPYEKYFSPKRLFRYPTRTGMEVSQRLSEEARQFMLGQNSILAWGADDVRFETPGWDEAIVEEAYAHPVSLIFGEDTIQHGHIATHPFFTYRFIANLGGLYHGHYQHLFADTELTEIARMAGVLRYLPNVVTRHLHYTVGTAPSDPTYARSERFNDADKAEFGRRAADRQRLATMVRAAAGAI